MPVYHLEATFPQGIEKPARSGSWGLGGSAVREQQIGTDPWGWGIRGSPRWVMAGPARSGTARGHWDSPRHQAPSWGWGLAQQDPWTGRAGLWGALLGQGLMALGG